MAMPWRRHGYSWRRHCHGASWHRLPWHGMKKITASHEHALWRCHGTAAAADGILKGIPRRPDGRKCIGIDGDNAMTAVQPRPHMNGHPCGAPWRVPWREPWHVPCHRTALPWHGHGPLRQCHGGALAPPRRPMASPWKRNIRCISGKFRVNNFPEENR